MVRRFSPTNLALSSPNPVLHPLASQFTYLPELLADELSRLRTREEALHLVRYFASVAGNTSGLLSNAQ